MTTHSPCTKRRYDSEHAAKRAHSSAPYRVRAYLCPSCLGWHVTNQEKRHVAPRPEDAVAKSLHARGRKRQRGTSTPTAVPPERQQMASLVERLAVKDRDFTALQTRIREEAARQRGAAAATKTHDDPDAPARKRCHEFAADIVDSLLWD